MSTALTFLGIVVSAAFGAWGIYLTIKYKYPGRITFVKQQSIALFDAIVKNLPDLAVLYKDAPVSPDLVLIEGALVNTGTVDISPSMVDEPLRAQLPEGYEWLAAKVVSSSDNFNARLTIDSPRIIIIAGNLFRRNEHVRIQALASVPPIDKSQAAIKRGDVSERLEEAIEFTHRIANTRRVKKTAVQEVPVLRKRLRRIALIITGLVLAFLVAGIVQLILGLPATVIFLYQPNDVPIKVRVTPQLDGTVNVRGVDQKYAETVPVAAFFSKCVGEPTIISDPALKYIIPAFIVTYIVIPLSYLLMLYLGYRRNKRLSRLLGMDEED